MHLHGRKQSKTFENDEKRGSINPSLSTFLSAGRNTQQISPVVQRSYVQKQIVLDDKLPETASLTVFKSLQSTAII